MTTPPSPAVLSANRSVQPCQKRHAGRGGTANLPEQVGRNRAESEKLLRGRLLDVLLGVVLLGRVLLGRVLLRVLLRVGLRRVLRVLLGVGGRGVLLGLVCHRDHRGGEGSDDQGSAD